MINRHYIYEKCIIAIRKYFSQGKLGQSFIAACKDLYKKKIPDNRIKSYAILIFFIDILPLNLHCN